jgi:hypothetical protein
LDRRRYALRSYWQAVPLHGGGGVTGGTVPKRKIAPLMLVFPFTVAVTVTWRKPAVESRTGAVIVHCVELQATPVGDSVPKLKVVPPGAVLKFVPETVTPTPPVTGPLGGEMPVTDGKTS